MPLEMNLPFDRYEMRQDKQSRTDGQAVYQGFAPPGTPASSANWLIYGYTYDAAGFITRRQVKIKGIWDNITTEIVV